MAQTEQEIVEKARTVAQELYARGKDDPEFTKQFLEDPVGTMREAGMPEETMAEALVASGVAKDEGDVQGYFLPGTATTYQVGNTGVPPIQDPAATGGAGYSYGW
jgi:hypothetical protein